MKLSPYDHRFTELSNNDMMLSFVAYWLGEAEDSALDKLGNMLGTEWTREQVEALSKKPTSEDQFKNAKRENMSLPLILGINPEVSDMLMRSFGVSKDGTNVAGGDYKPQAGEEIVKLDEGFSKEEFLRFAKMAPVISDDPKQNEPKPMDPDKDRAPKEVKRMQEQIDAAKRASRIDRGR